ncbi:MAG: DUF3710 domain-containing protein [Marmoricola sp.]
MTHEVGNAGGKVEAAEGELGDEAQLRIPMKGPDGQTVQSSLRFIGFEGPTLAAGWHVARPSGG